MNELTGYPNRGWWLFLLRGIVAIAFGVAAFVWPTLTLTVLIALFGAYVFVDGAFGLAHAIRSRGWLPHWWLGALEGALGVVLGLLVVPRSRGYGVRPADDHRDMGDHRRRPQDCAGDLECAVKFGGMVPDRERRGLSILFGVLLFVVPEAGILSVIWLIGFYAILFGGLIVGLALRLRRETVGLARMASPMSLGAGRPIESGGKGV